MNLMAWLSEPATHIPFDTMWNRVREIPHPIPGVEHPTRLQVITALIGMNGGSLQVSGWGITQGGGPYGRFGLEQNEALALISSAAFLDGWFAATDRVEEPAFLAAIEAEFDRVEALAKGKAANE